MIRTVKFRSWSPLSGAFKAVSTGYAWESHPPISPNCFQIWEEPKLGTNAMAKKWNPIWNPGGALREGINSSLDSGFLQGFSHFHIRFCCGSQPNLFSASKPSIEEKLRKNRQPCSLGQVSAFPHFHSLHEMRPSMLQYLWAECVSKARAKIRLPSLGQISVVHERKSTYGLNLNFWSQSNRILIGQNPKLWKPQGFSTRCEHRVVARGSYLGRCRERRWFWWWNGCRGSANGKDGDNMG